MRRLLATALLALALPVLVVAGLGASEDDGSGYRVRAIFDNVAAAVPGEDVKVAGARVGEIEEMDVTEDNKAAVTLHIQDGRFAPFRSDARCRIRPQQLIGEKFVECQPGTVGHPALREIEEGEGEGHHLLPLERTSSQVDLDLPSNIMRLPYRQRFGILLAELGAGLAARGDELNEVVHRANPALRETDRVLRILARQNRVLVRLAEDSDRALGPLAREKARVSGFIRQANATGQATAERREDISRGIARLPRFLRELRPYMADFESFAGEMAPVAADLRRAGPDLSRVLAELGPFSRVARPAFRSLGRLAVRGRPALIRARPVIRDLGRFGRDAAPVSADLDRLTRSLDETGAIRPLMEFFFFTAASTNGFDDVGHYLRARLIANVCSSYATSPASGCSGKFGGEEGSAAAAEASFREERGGGEPGRDPTDEIAPLQDLSSLPRGEDPEAREERERNLARMREQAKRPSPALDEVADPMLDYFLGDTP